MPIMLFTIKITKFKTEIASVKLNKIFNLNYNLKINLKFVRFLMKEPTMTTSTKTLIIVCLVI